MPTTAQETIEQLALRDYQAGFETLVEQDVFPPGLDEDVVRVISAKKNEPEWLLEWRLKAYRHWLTMSEPTWAERPLPADRLPGDHLLLGAQAEEGSPRASTRSIPSCSRPSRSSASRSTSRSALAGVAVDAVFDSVSVATTFKGKLAEMGVIFCSFSEAVQRASRAGARSTSARWCPTTTTSSPRSTRRSSATARSCYIPKGVRCPMELSTYFRINAANTGQFERTLIVAEEGAYVSYLEGCTAPMRDENQLHAAVVELVALDERARSSTRRCRTGTPATRKARAASTTSSPSAAHAAAATRRSPGRRSRPARPSPGSTRACILQGDDSVGEFYSVALTNNCQQADTGTKMIHIGKNTKSTIVSKGISAGHGQNTYRGLVKILQGRRRRAQLLAVRLAAAGRPVRRAHLPVHRGAEPDGAGRARGVDLEDRRGPDLLLQAARPVGRGRRSA